MKGQDLIGLAQTGSGKTAAFGLPIIQGLISNQKPFSALILAPTRELILQISEHLRALGENIGVKVCSLLGGIDIGHQAIMLSKEPHIIVSTPGRIIDHLNNTAGFSLKNLRFLVFDEADELLGNNFEQEINLIMKEIPDQRTTFLFSATMTEKVEKLKKASLKNPVKIEVNRK